MKSPLVLSCFGLQAVAFPFVLEALESRQLPDPTPAQIISKARSNCGGGHVCLTFDANAQRVSTTGDHAYQKPAVDEIRGPCPGLNAASNHAYLSRSGVTTILETITGLGALYGMSPDLAGFLAAYAVVLTGDPITQQWSIGGPLPSNGLVSGLLGTGQGISFSHNNYEGDSSIARPDAYLNNGDAHSLDVKRFASAYAVGMDNDRYTLDKFSQQFEKNVKESIATNPYYFAAPFSTTLVSPAAYNFVINFMSNHSAEVPGGYLDGAMFKTFFGITGDYPNFKWLKGQERVPDNWYRRPLTQAYNAADVFVDLGIEFLAYPDTFRLGGNTNGVNTYAGVSLTDFTGGAYNLTNLFGKGAKYGPCFFSQLAQAAIPDFASIPLQLLTPVTNLINDFFKPITGGLDCPLVNKFDQGLFNKYPGRKYSPTGPATNYRE